MLIRFSGERFQMAPFSVILFGVVVWMIAYPEQNSSVFVWKGISVDETSTDVNKYWCLTNDLSKMETKPAKGLLTTNNRCIETSQ